MTSEIEQEEKFAQCPVCHTKYPSHLNKIVCPEDRTLLLVPSASAAKDDLLDEVLNGRYKLVELINKGSTCSVYKAVHELMERVVAVKVIAPELTEDPISVRRFQLEARAASHASHPGVITVYDFGFTDSGQSYLVMDYLNGSSLRSIVEKEGPLNLTRFNRLFYILCNAASHLHEQGIVHGNLSPSNFQITRLVHKDWPRGLPEIGELVVKPDEELPIVIDFRLARLMPTSSKNDTGLTGKDEGDPLYMSPEQCLIAKIDPRRDIYSMGCAMYFALTGKPPFQGDSDTETMQMHLDTQPEANLLPAEVRHVVLKAMAKDPDDRVQTMGELAKALEARAVTSETKS